MMMQFMMMAVLVLTLGRTINAVAAPKVAPGCEKLCRSGYFGDYLSCTSTCPPIDVCTVAMTDPTVDEHRYVSDGRGPRLCREGECTGGNVFLEQQCMLDCPSFWCVKYGRMPVFTTPSPTTRPTTITSTTTRPPRPDLDLTSPDIAASTSGSRRPRWEIFIPSIAVPIALVLFLVVYAIKKKKSFKITKWLSERIDDDAEPGTQMETYRTFSMCDTVDDDNMTSTAESDARASLEPFLRSPIVDDSTVVKQPTTAPLVGATLVPSSTSEVLDPTQSSDLHRDN